MQLILSMIINITMIRLQRFARFRQLHTIVSRETIKPSSPTPPHLKTHNLALVDHFAPNFYMPFIFFYKKYNHGDVDVLKKSLSQTLSSYYTFAGTFSGSHIDCNDEGVEFLEASNDSRLDDFIFKNDQDETLHQLIPNALRETSTMMLKVQLNHFVCGGAALTLSPSHKAGDGFTMTNFINHWATVARGGSPPKNPTFLSSSVSNFKVPEFDYKGTNKVKYATRRFMFPNSKLNELKNKVTLTELGAMHPTRVETLSSLIFKCGVGAATTLSGSLKQPSHLYQVVDMRKKFKNCPEIAAGNICMLATAKMPDSGEIKLNEVIAKLRKDIMEIKEVRDVDEVGEMFANKLSTLKDDQSRTYNFSSLCRFPFYEMDFGFGKPAQVIHHNGVLDGNVIHLMDTPTGDGIEATVHMAEEEMAIFKDDKELLAYAQDI